MFEFIFLLENDQNINKFLLYSTKKRKKEHDKLKLTIN